MHVPEDILRCVAFIGKQDVDTSTGREFLRFGGTAFFVSIPSEKRPNERFICLVTAKHVVDAVSGRSYVTRVNSFDGSPKPVWADTGSDANVKWWFHPTEADAVDVAVAPWVIAPDEDIQSIPVELFLTAASIDATGIGPGDQVFFPG
jgi:hypothetical protein